MYKKKSLYCICEKKLSLPCLTCVFMELCLNALEKRNCQSHACCVYMKVSLTLLHIRMELSIQCLTNVNIIRLYYECEGRIGKSVPVIAVLHHEACPVMINGDPEARVFLYYPHTNNGFFFLLTTGFIYLFILR